MSMKKRSNGAVLIEVLIGLFITAIVFVAVYTTISVSLINTRYLQQARETACFASQIAEAFSSSADCSEQSCFDYIKAKYGSVSVETEIDLADVDNYLASIEAIGVSTVNYRKLINENDLTDYQVQLFMIAPNAVYQTENSLGTPFGAGIYSPDENLMTFELRVQRNSKDWGGNGFRIYKERKPAVISYIFQVHRR